MKPRTETRLPPVIAIDGPTASGKGTVSELLADRLGFNYLDSGAVYRVLAVAVLQRVLNPDNQAHRFDIEQLAHQLSLRFIAGRVLLEGKDVTQSIRTEQAGSMASKLAVIPEVRSGLLQRQRDFRAAPGLVADGRDMASVVFPDAVVQVFLTACAEVRARRRLNQLVQRGVNTDFEQLLADLKARDKRDQERALAPLKPTAGATVLDCSELSVDQVLDRLIRLCASCEIQTKALD